MTCAVCKRTIRGPRLIVREQFWCSECAYYEDMGKPNPNKVEAK